MHLEIALACTLCQGEHASEETPQQCAMAFDHYFKSLIPILEAPLLARQLSWPARVREIEDHAMEWRGTYHDVMQFQCPCIDVVVHLRAALSQLGRVPQRICIVGLQPAL
eukprot:352020-Chlamydomonas_euryale.AAC.4